jgi:SWI/SNF-related matrix-associated actin-dependent regulator of chromatin subfamily A-like protein 1
MNNEQLADFLYCPEPRIAALKDFQLAAAKHMILWPMTVNALPTGKGKTVVTIAAIDALDLFPAIIVCSNRVALQWAGEVVRWLEKEPPFLRSGITVSVLEGRTPRAFNGEYLSTLAGNETVQVPVNDLSCDVIIAPYSLVYDWAETLAPRGYRVLTIDELRVRARGTDQTRACRYLGAYIKRTKMFKHIYGLSADSVVNRPRDLRSILEVLQRPEALGGWDRFARTFCNRQVKYVLQRDGRTRRYYDDSGSSNLLQLNRELKAMGIMFRMTEQECNPDAPEKVRVVVPVTLSNQAEYDRAEADVLAYVREMAMLDPNISPEKREDHAAQAAYNASRAKALARLAVLRRLAGLGKVQAFIEWLQDFFEENPGAKFVAFGHHKAVQEAIAQAFQGCARIVGDQTTQESDENKLRFQRDPQCVLIVVSEEAGGEGLNLSAAHHAGCVEYPWTGKTMNQMEGRCYQRLDNPHGLTMFYSHAAGSIDDKMAAILRRKLNMVSQIQDGKEADDFLSVSIESELLDSLCL